jgi:ketosteroid isomerase-like protein
LIREAAQLHPAFATAFNAGDYEAVEALFEPQAVFVGRPGQVLSGAARKKSILDFLQLGLPIELTPRQVYVCDDLALLISDHRIDGIEAGGRSVAIEGTSADVARRSARSGWRIVIDNPPGTAS